MSVDKFKFVSPGVFIDEIDESGIPALPERMGPMIIGRFEKGPANRPIKVNSFKEFVKMFGNPAPGNASGDIWRSGEMTAPTYAAYAVKAWLRNNSPCTVYRVLGEEAGNADNTDTAKAGWKTTNTFTSDIGDCGGAYGLFVMPNPDSYPGAAATASITVANEGYIENGDTITLIATDGTAVVATATAATNTDAATDGNVEFAHNGVGTSAQATLIATAINYNNKFTAEAVGAKVNITQVGGGSAGNSTLSAVDGGGAGPWFTLHGNFAGGTDHAVTGTLAAIWYVDAGAVVLTGTARDGVARQGAGLMVKSDSGLKFTAKVLDGAGSEVKTATFNFDRDSDQFIRKVWNTDPAKTNSFATSNAKNYWLGESFESNVRDSENSKLAITGTLAAASSDHLGVILALDGTLDATATDVVWGNHQIAARAAQTGWFISQDTRGEVTASFDPVSHTEQLFKFHALDSGESANRDFKVSIVDIKVPTDNFNKYGNFTVQVRSAHDLDGTPKVLEQFSNCNLDPTSANYIGRVVGERYYTYDETNKRLIEHGDNPNRSNILRVEVANDIAQGGGEGLNPFGVYGPAVVKTHEVIRTTQNTIISAGSGSSANCLPSASLSPDHQASQLISGSTPFTCSVEWPTSRLRASSSEGSLVMATKAYFGYQSPIKDSRRFDKTNLDLFRGQPASFDPTADASSSTLQQYSWVFTLDDVMRSNQDSDHAVWVKDARKNGLSYTAVSASGDPTTGEPVVLKEGFNKFTSPMFGGFDGFDVTEQDNFRNSKMATTPAATEKNNSAFYSLKKAIDVTADKDYVEYDLLALPGITNSSLNTQLVNSCEDRADALAVIDMAGGYEPPHERTSAEADSLGSVTTTVNNLKDLNINSSYGCTFYPWVKVRDTARDAMLYVPPSVVALGTFSSAQRQSAVWFAPAGFTRGGLSEGSAGLPVVGVRQRLTSDERDKLYDANINPIASFPAEGIVIFGQKTLQVTQSALDRINVRRLLIFLKKEISRIASRVLFDQNVQQTWDRFTGQVVPFLEGVQAGLGLTDFRVVLDDSTTTPDLVDRNILYAKIFLKPARAIEFIALDFIITRSGASFDD